MAAGEIGTRVVERSLYLGTVVAVESYRREVKKELILRALFQLGEGQRGNFAQRLKHALTGDRHTLHYGLALHLKLLGELFNRKDAGNIAFIELQDIRNGLEIEFVFLQVFAEVLQSFQVCVQALFLRIRHEDDSVGALQDQLAAGFIKNLTGNCIKMNSSFKAAHRAQVNRQKIEKQGAVRFRRKRNHLPFLRGTRMVIDPLKVGCLTAQTWTVVDQLAINFASRKIDKRHSCPD